VSDTQVSVGIY